MKKKLLLTLTLVAVLVCALAICISAETPAQYMEFKVLLEGDADYTTAYVSAYKDGNGKVDMYTVKVPMAYDFYSDIDFTEAIDKTAIVKIDMSDMMAYGFNNNNIKQFIAASDNSPYANVTEIKLPVYPGNFNQVANSLCKNWTSLTTIDFGSAYQTGDYCFSGCTALTELVIPESITKLNNYTFQGCTSLKKAEILGKTTIDSGIFQGCTSLTDVNLVQVNNIGNSMFNGCTSLTEITIPETATSIGAMAFYNTKLVSLHVPAKVKSIGYQVLEDVTTFTTLTFAENSELETIGHRTFQGTNLSGALVIPDSVKEINYSAFTGTDITSVVLPSGLTTLTSNTFNGCTSLESIELPENLEKIETGALRYCSALTEVEIPSTVASIGEYVFDGCTEVTIDIDFSSFTSIGKSAFKGYTGYIGVLDISNALTIGEAAFSGCIGITGVTLSKDLAKLESSTFSGCTGITSIHIPASVTYIGNNCFDDCTSLSTITFEMEGAKLEKIGPHGFENTAIKEIVFPNSLLRIGQSTFNSCTKLESVNFGASFVDFNASNAGQPPFANGSTLKYIYLSDTFNGVRDKVFSWNDNNANEYNKYYLNLTIFYTGDKAQAEAILQASQGVNTYISSMTLISADDYAKAVAEGTLVEGVSGTPARYFVYDYNKCEAFYEGVHAASAEIKKAFLGQAFASEYKIYTECGRECGAENVIETIGQLIHVKGYATSEIPGNKAMMHSFVVDKSLVSKYQEHFADLKFGVLAVGENTSSPFNGNLIDAQGNKAHEKIAMVDFTEKGFDEIEIKIGGLDSYENTNLYFCGFVIGGENVYYIENDAIKTQAETVTYNDVCAILTGTGNEEENENV